MKNFKRVLSLALAALMVIGGLVIAPVDAKADETYTRVYDIKDITDGGDIVIIIKFYDNYYALPNANSAKLSNLVTVDADAITDSTLTVGNLPVWTATKGSTYNGVTLSYAADGATNYLGWKSSANFNADKDEWRIEYGSEEGLFRFVAKETETDSSVRVISLQSKENETTPNRFGPYAYSYIAKGSSTLQDKYYYGCEFMVYKSGTVTASNAVTYPQDIPAIQNPTDDSVIDAAYKAMYDGVKLEGEYTLTGVVSAESKASNNVATVNINVGLDEKLLQCYKLNCGDITSEFAANYIVKVKGTLSYYNGKVQISNGELISYEEPIVIPDPVLTTPEAIIDAAYEHMTNNGTGNLKDSGNGNETFELEGKVIAVNTGYANDKISVTIVIDGKEDKPIQCYNMVGGTVTDVSKVDVGDTIKAKGTITHYNGIVEFNSGCTLEAYTASTDTTTYNTEAEILAAASELEVGYGLAGKQTLTGVITTIDVEYSSSYKNVSVTMKVGDTAVKVYRVSGTGADVIAVGDTITVTGNLMMYAEDTLEFVANCSLDSYTLADDDLDDTDEEDESDSIVDDTTNSETTLTQKEIVDAAYALGANEYLGGSKDCTYTLIGVIKEIISEPSEYNGEWDMKLTIEVEGKEFLCYFLKGAESDLKSLVVGDTIKVTGPIKNYVNATTSESTIEFERPQLVAINPAEEIDPAGDINNVGVYMILLAGAALAIAGVVSKKKFA